MKRVPVAQAHAPDSPSALFEQTLLRETLISERTRAAILAGLSGAMLVSASIALVTPGFLEWLFNKGVMPPPQLIVMLVALFVYECSAWFVFGSFLRRGVHLPRFWRYINALVEVSLPTYVLFFVAELFGPLYVTIAPPVFIYGVFIVMNILTLDPWLCLFVGAVVTVEYLVLTFVFVIPAAQPGDSPMLTSVGLNVLRGGIWGMMGVLAALVTLQLRRHIGQALAAVQERQRVTTLFGRHVSPAVVERLLAYPGGVMSEKRTVCVMFVDVRDFTHFSEQRTPEAVVAYLNRLFDILVACIDKRQGIVNKFLGDGLLAVFGAPFASETDVENAVGAALDILAAIEVAVASGELPPTRLGVGLHAGEAIVGSVGALARQEYTLIGDVVNVAARIEQLNKTHGSSLLVSEVVWAQVAAVYGARGVALGAVEVRGHAAVSVYRLA